MEIPGDTGDLKTMMVTVNGFTFAKINLRLEKVQAVDKTKAKALRAVTPKVTKAKVPKPLTLRVAKEKVQSLLTHAVTLAKESKAKTSTRKDTIHDQPR